MDNHKVKREKFASRLGFLLISAGCAIGLGNVWRFPYTVGAYGGAAFIIFYLLFLICFALPIMIMEFSVGRASRCNIAGSFTKLQKPNHKWHYFGFIGIIGNYLLMMFYTTVSGWMTAYCFYMINGSLNNLSPEQIGLFFSAHLNNPSYNILWMAITVILGFSICSLGLQKGVEKSTKIMMIGLIVLIFALVIRSITLPNANAGIHFYLWPDFSKIIDKGLWVSIHQAMGQAFFTLSIGIGSMAIFGSYFDKERSLTGESINIMTLDTAIALLSGLIIFPACFSFNVNPEAGPGLVFVTLPNIFNNMPLGQIWGSLFFLFMSFASLTTVIAVFENIVAFGIDIAKLSRKKSSFINAIIIFIGSLPCALGFSLLKDIEPLGKGSSILDLEDFIVSNNLLPLGSLVYLLFCCTHKGWGWENFLKEANTGKGKKFPEYLKGFLVIIFPPLMFIIFLSGYIERFF